MNKGIILFHSKYGSTRKYAEWLIELTKFDCEDTSKADIDMVSKYEIIILCGGIYASGISELSFLKKYYKYLKDKKIAVFCVGASPYNKEAFNEIKLHNLKDELNEISMFYGRGAWDEESMTFKDRTLCKMLQKAVAKKDPNTYEPWMKALMCAVGKKIDWTNKEYLKPLLEYINN